MKKILIKLNLIYNTKMTKGIFAAESKIDKMKKNI